MSKIRLLMIGLILIPFSLYAQSTAFTYQGTLQFEGAPANGLFDITFVLYDAPTGGNQVNTPSYLPEATVVNGQLPTVTIDFGPVYTGAPRYLEIMIRPTGGTTFTTLSPRQRVTSAPYAVRAVNAGNAEMLGGVAANQYLTTNAASTGFLQNSTTPQSGNFNITGTGTANVFSATQFNSGGSRILKTGNLDVFLGVGAGVVAPTDGANTFVGGSAGANTTTGVQNAFFGSNAGESNTGGGENSFFGYRAGRTVFGSGNSFVGKDAGFLVVQANNTSLFGFGTSTQGNLTNATAIGWRAFVGRSNSLVLGSINGINGATADTNVGVGEWQPTYKLHVKDASNTGLRVQTNLAGGTVASFGGVGEFRIDAPSTAGGRFTVLENGNIGIGATTPTARLSVFGGGFQNNLLVSDSNTTATTFDLANTSSGGGAWRFQSLGGADPNRAGNLELWRVGGAFSFSVKPNGFVGIGTGAPAAPLHVDGNVRVTNGYVYVTNPNTVILTSPNGACWGLSVSNTGALATFAVNPCP